jgi:Peptidase family C25
VRSAILPAGLSLLAGIGVIASDLASAGPVPARTTLRLDSFTATASGRHIDLAWRTGFEVDNLGFHIYRDDGGGPSRLTAAPIIGSALLIGSGVALPAGQLYSWADTLPPDRPDHALYWLEDVDLQGRRTMHGPVRVAKPPAGVRPARSEQALARSVVLAPPAGAASGPPQPPPAAPPLLGPGDENPGQWALAAGAAVKLGVDHEGWYEISASALIEAGLDGGVDPAKLALFVEGREVPMTVRGEADGALDPSDAIGFFGRGLDAPFTDTRVYWLATTNAGGRRIAQATPANAGLARPDRFRATVEARPRTVYFSALSNGDESNFFGPAITATPVTQKLLLRHLVDAPALAELEVGVQGVSDGQHIVGVAIGARSLGTLVLADRQRRSVRLAVPAGLLPDGGEVEVSITAQAGDTDVTLLDFVRASHARAFIADDGVLAFSVPGGAAVDVSGFAAGEAVEILDVTDETLVSRLAAGSADGGGGFRAIVPGRGRRKVIARSATHTETLRSLTANRPSHWHDPGQSGDLVMIGRAQFLPALAPLQRLRQAQGWTVVLVDVEDLYDELSFGAKHPGAIRSFLARARAAPHPPQAVILVGDASLDPRQFLGLGDLDLLPTKLVDTDFMETSSDDWFTDLDEDGIADVPVGRLPARTAAEVAALVGKLVQAPVFASTEAAAAGGPLVFVNDANDPDLDFVATSLALQSDVPAALRKIGIDRGAPGVDPLALLRAAMLEGPPFLSYVGHGSVGLWRGGLLSAESVADLGGVGPGAFWSELTCLNGYFQDANQPSLAEALLARPTGGAFGIWTSSGFTDGNAQVAMGRAFAHNLFVPGMSVGQAARLAKQSATDMDIRRTWILFGDPTWQMVARPPDITPDGDAGAGAPDAADTANTTTTGRVSARRAGAGCACSLGVFPGGRALPFMSVTILLAAILAFRRKLRL